MTKKIIQLKIKDNIKNLFHNQYEEITKDSILVNNILITTNIQNIFINDTVYVKLLVLDEFVDDQLLNVENIHILYYNNNDLNNFDNIFNDTIAWLTDIPETFDHEKYLKNNPEIINYHKEYADANNISERKRLFHHFLLYYYKFLTPEEKLWLKPIDYNFDEKYYETLHPEAAQYHTEWAKKNGYSKRRRLFHHYCLYSKFRLKINNYFTSENIELKNSGIHVFPYEESKIENVNIRQTEAIRSYLTNKISEIQIYSFGTTNPNIKGIEYFNINDINYSNSKCSRDYYYLGDILENSLNITARDDYIIYTNSDCQIKDGFYNFILGSNYEYIEFFRLETSNDIIIGQNKDGIDGFAIKNYKLKSLLEENILPKNLILGAPYWDAVFSSIARKFIANKYQDTSRLFHNKHTPRWSFGQLDYAGQHNLSILNNLYDKNTIHCRKAEIKSGTLVARILDKKTNYDQLKNCIFNERFSPHKITSFDYNYLFIEQKFQNDMPKLTDSSIGTTAGTRYFISKDQTEEVLKKEIEQYDRYIILENDEQLSENTKFIYQNTSPKLGIVFCFFGNDPIRISAAKRSILEFKKQTIWNKSQIAFVELLGDHNSNFDFQMDQNIYHIKIQEKHLNKNLFQKECLWNIGAKYLLDKIDNLIFIDIDTFSQQKFLFAKANKLLEYNPNIVFQLGNSIITQKEDGTVTRVQWLWNSFAKTEAEKPYCFNPCGGFAISKKIFNQIDGFNPYGFLYGGDILFLYEIDKRTHRVWDWIINNMKIFQNRPRDINSSNVILKNEESPLIHCWHGDAETRPYHTWGLVFNKLNFDSEDICLDADRLLSWTNETTKDKYAKFFENRNLIVDVSYQNNLYI